MCNGEMLAASGGVADILPHFFYKKKAGAPCGNPAFFACFFKSNEPDDKDGGDSPAASPPFFSVVFRV